MTAEEAQVRPLRDDDGEVGAPTQVGRLSVLGQLQTRREQIKVGTTTDLKVESWSDPEIFVRFKPIDHGIIRSTSARIEKAPPKSKAQVEVDSNCDVLIRACVGVFARLPGYDNEFSLRPGDPEGTLTTFDKDLAANLGLDADGTSARDVVKALYIFDGHILSTAAKIAEFSGYREQEADEGVLGE